MTEMKPKPTNVATPQTAIHRIVHHTVDMSYWLASLMLSLLFLGTFLITIGATSVNTCRGEPRIPWWLILQGTLHLVYVLIKFYMHHHKRRAPWFDVVIFAVLSLNVVFGAIIVYNSDTQQVFISQTDYCPLATHSTAVLYISTYLSIICIILPCCLCFAFICSLCLEDDEDYEGVHGISVV